MEELWKGLYEEQKVEEVEQAGSQLQMWDSHFRIITQIGQLLTCWPQLHKDPFHYN